MSGRTWSRQEQQLIAQMIDSGATQDQIATALRCSVRTFRRHFGEEWRRRRGHRSPQRREFTAEERQTVAAMVGFGNTHAEIATVLRCHLSELLAAFPEELQEGSIAANVTVANALFRKATDGSVDAQKFWLRARAGWIDRQPKAGDPSDPVVPLSDAEIARSLDEDIAALSPESQDSLEQVLVELGAKRSRLSTAPPGPDDTVQ